MTCLTHPVWFGAGERYVSGQGWVSSRHPDAGANEAEDRLLRDEARLFAEAIVRDLHRAPPVRAVWYPGRQDGRAKLHVTSREHGTDIGEVSAIGECELDGEVDRDLRKIVGQDHLGGEAGLGIIIGAGHGVLRWVKQMLRGAAS